MINEPAVQDVAKILKARMARCAFLHFDKIDIRTGTMLELAGVIKDDSPATIDCAVSEVVLDVNNVRRITSASGPTVFYRDSTQSEKQFGIEMHTLLLYADESLRNAAWQHFVSLVNSFQNGSSSRLFRELNAYRSALLSSNTEEWHRAALKLHDMIEGDVLCQIAGLRQSIAERYDDGLRHWLPKILSPRSSVIDFSDHVVMKPTTAYADILAIVEDIALNSPTINQACDSYVDRLGILPLAGRASFSDMVQLWRQTHSGERDVIDEIFTWAAQAGSLARYYACIYCVGTMDELSDSEFSFCRKAWSDFADPSSETDKVSGDGLFWRVSTSLAQHYLRHFEIVAPGLDRELVTMFSWWLAQRVSDVFSESPKRTAHLVDVALKPAISITEVAWRLANPSIGKSVAAISTHWKTSLWLVSFMSVIHLRTATSLKSQLSEEQRQQLQSDIFRQIFLWWPTYPKSEVPPVFLFERLSHQGIESIGEMLSEEQSKSFLFNLEGIYDDLSNANTLLRKLKDAADADEANQLILTNAARLLAVRGCLPLDDIWALMTDPEWRNKVLQKFSPPALEIFSLALSWSFVGGGDKWVAGLPHLYAAVCEEAISDPKALESFFAMTVLACMHSHSMSAIERLLRGKNAGNFRELSLRWRSQLQLRKYAAYPWVSGRARALSAAISGSV